MKSTKIYECRKAYTYEEDEHLISKFVVYNAVESARFTAAAWGYLRRFSYNSHTNILVQIQKFVARYIGYKI